MKSRFLSSGRYAAIMGVAATLGVLCMPVSNVRAAWHVMDTEDVLYLADGRVMHGKIIDETSGIIRFQIIDRKTGLTTTMSFTKDQVLRVERGVEVVGEAAQTSGAGSGGANAEGETKPAEPEDMSLPGIYVVPFKGEFGTDIYYKVYEPIIEDIKKHKPECIVIRMNSDSREYKLNPNPRAIEDYLNFEEYRELVHLFKDNFRDTRQVLWIENSIGVSSMVALAWDEIYMQPDGYLDGLQIVNAVTSGWQDEDVKAKMQAAFSGIAKGFVEHGKRDLNLAHALMFPTAKLSASFKGRNVVWSLDDKGEVLVDDREDWTPSFDAEAARDLRISEETVEPVGDDGLADLAFILGYREYRKCKGIGEDVINSYVEDWRAAFERTERLMTDYNDFGRFATGDDEKQYLGKQVAALESIVSAMNRYKAVEREWERRGVSKLQLELEIKRIRERLREINEQERQRGRDRGPGGGGGRGPGIPGGGG